MRHKCSVIVIHMAVIISYTAAFVYLITYLA